MVEITELYLMYVVSLEMYLKNRATDYNLIASNVI